MYAFKGGVCIVIHKCINCPLLYLHSTIRSTGLLEVSLVAIQLGKSSSPGISSGLRVHLFLKTVPIIMDSL